MKWRTPSAHTMLTLVARPLNRLSAILSLLQPLDRYKVPSAIGLSRPRTGAWWTFRIFFIFFQLRGGEGGSPERQGGRGVGFLKKNPRGGVNIFFRGRNARQGWEHSTVSF